MKHSDGAHRVVLEARDLRRLLLGRQPHVDLLARQRAAPRRLEGDDVLLQRLRLYRTCVLRRARLSRQDVTELTITSCSDT